MEGYQVSAQCMALVRDNCLLSTKDAPELGYVRESTDKQYVPDVFYKVSERPICCRFFLYYSSFNYIIVGGFLCVFATKFFICGRLETTKFLPRLRLIEKGGKTFTSRKIRFSTRHQFTFFWVFFGKFFSLFFNNRIEKLRAADRNRA